MSGFPPSKRVEFYPLDAHGQRSARAITAQFNPTKLDYTITNTAARAGGSQRSQRVDESSAKLNLELVYDTTDSGEDVRLRTQEIASLMEPNAQTKVPPKVDVEWGAFRFRGIVDSYKETLDFFSEEGIPLRAGVTLTMSSPAEQNRMPRQIFHFAGGGTAAAISAGGPLGSADERAVEAPTRAGASTTDAAQEAGDPSRARELAALNGVEDMRHPAGETDSLLVPDDEADLLDAIAFVSGGAGAGLAAGAGFGAQASAGFGAQASAGFGAQASASFGAQASAGFGAQAGAGFGAQASAGFGAQAGAGFGAQASASFGAQASAGFGAQASAGFGAQASASFGAQASAGFGAQASAGFGAQASAGFGAQASAYASTRVAADSFAAGPLAGARASAGVAASEGAFALLRAPVAAPRRPLDPSRLTVRVETESYSIGEQTHYAVGGRVVAGAHGYHAEMHQSRTFTSRITFEED